MHSINWHSVFFLLFSLLACLFALAVVFSSHIVRMAFYLVLSLGATAGLFFLAGADFVGSMQLLIYVGGTLVLLVFGVMLTAQGPFISMKTRSGDWVMSALVGGSLLAVLVPTAFKIGDWQNRGRADGSDSGGQAHFSARSSTTVPAAEGRKMSQTPTNDDAAMTSAQAPPTATRLGLGLLGARVDRLDRPETPLTSTMAGYLLPFEIVSVHLLVVLIGAAYLARTKRRKKVSGTNSALDV
jgi:NADH:ubiquinone oxidoreductase subunit 6 (subunit J)